MYTWMSSVLFLERITLRFYHYSQIKSLTCLNNHKMKCPSQGMCPTPGENYPTNSPEPVISVNTRFNVKSWGMCVQNMCVGSDGGWGGVYGFGGGLDGMKVNTFLFYIHTYIYLQILLLHIRSHSM